MKPIPMLIGLAGHVKGEHIALEYGRSMVVGRSRSADCSLRRMPIYQAMSPDERENDKSLATVSRKHFRVTSYNERSVELENLSPNGTLLDNEPLEKVVIDNLATTAHIIKFGDHEKFSLELGVPDPVLKEEGEWDEPFEWEKK